VVEVVVARIRWRGVRRVPAILIVFVSRRYTSDQYGGNISYVDARPWMRLQRTDRHHCLLCRIPLIIVLNHDHVKKPMHIAT